MKTCPTCQGSYPNNYVVCPADGSQLIEAGHWAEGSVVRGKYRLLAKVGQGGMGSVYKALHLAFDELRALKVIAPELLSDELFVKRFKHEAVITRRLQHPNAVRVDDIDEAEDGRPFIVMEFIEGKSLKKVISEEGPLAVPRVISMMKQAAAALDAAHRLGMVHRDIKPDNIALVDSPDGETVKVLDFGIAKVKEARMGDGGGMTLTGAGVVIGTPQYMSPEQAMGKRGDDLDGRADLYSLGVVMYQMLTADLPFRADTTMEMLLAHMQKPPAPIGALHPELQVPENVAALTMRLLEKSRDMRPASARVLIQELERLEKELASPGMTRVVAPGELIRSNEGRAPAGSGRGAAGQGIPPLPQAPAARAAAARQSGQQSGVRPQPVALQPPMAVPKRAESRWGMWVAVLVLLVGIGGGGWYIATHTTTFQPQPMPSSSPAPAPAPSPAPVSNPSSTAAEPTTTPAANPAPQTKPEPDSEPAPEPARPIHKAKIAQHKVESPAPAPAPKPAPAVPAVNPKDITAKISLGDFHYKRGEYDDAIASYREGLNLDPSNATLRKKLDDTIKACRKENAILNEGLNCGSQ